MSRPPPLTPEELHRRLLPGCFSTVGFLGPDERLDDVRRRDEQTLARLGRKPEELAAALEALLGDLDWLPFSAPRHVRHYEIRIKQYRGMQTCPWSADDDDDTCNTNGQRLSSIDWHITNLQTEQEMRGPGLIVHLIRDHHFFEGPASPYRVDPEQLCELLEL